MSTSEGAAPVAGEQQHLAWCSAVPSGGWKARCSCGYESDTFYDVATASAYADAHREGAAPPDPKPAQGDPQPAERAPAGGEPRDVTKPPFADLGRMIEAADAAPPAPSVQDAEDEAWLDALLRDHTWNEATDHRRQRLLARLRAVPGAGQAPAEQDPRQRAADAIGCEVDEVDDDPRLAEITAAVYAETGPATLGPLVFAVTTNGDVGVWSEDQPVGEDVPCLGAGNTATHALQRMYRRLLHPTPLPAAPAGEQGEALAAYQRLARKIDGDIDTGRLGMRVGSLVQLNMHDVRQLCAWVAALRAPQPEGDRP